MTTSLNTRKVGRIIEGLSVSDGDNVQLQRIIGTHLLRNLDPFIMLDEFCSEESGAEFPDHPHRGFQTVTYLLEGNAQHKDSKGHAGVLRSGSVQWMNAGRGIIHSESIKPENGRMWGFQLWVNLPAAEKMSAPAYQEYAPDDIPLVELANGVSVKVIAGRTHSGQEGAVKNIVSQPLFMDVRIDSADGQFTQEIPQGHTAFMYVYDGIAKVDGFEVPRGHLIELDDTGLLQVNGPVRFLLIAGAPINEPIVQHGPFVMNTKDEIRQAFDDYAAGTFA